MAESIQRIIGRRGLAGQYLQTAQQIIDTLEATVRGWSYDPTPFHWGGKRHAPCAASAQPPTTARTGRLGRLHAPSPAPSARGAAEITIELSSDPLVENVMYPFKTLMDDRLWARNVDVQDAEVAVRVGIINRMLVLAHPNSMRIA